MDRFDQNNQFKLSALQTDMTSSGLMKAFVTAAETNIPIPNAKVEIFSDDAPFGEFTTDSSGQSEEVNIPAPPVAYSEQPDEPRPYAKVDVRVTADGYESAQIAGTEILPETASLQPVRMAKTGVIDIDADTDIEIPENTLYGDYPEKIPESEIKPIAETGEIVLSRVVIPEYVVVHDGLPTNANAKDYWVKYKDYVKNVASSEIYATWPRETIKANVLCIQSFVLNRVFTEWYRNQGYNFTITTSTAFDQKYIHGRNIFEPISEVVDEIFNQYLSRPGVKQPIFTSYCSGSNGVTCSGLKQWGSKDLGDNGLNALEIIRRYYGNNMNISTADAISGVSSSYPGYALTIGSEGEKVLQAQNQLNRIAQNYPLIPKITADGVYGQATADAVKVFQKVFDLPQTGVIDFKTWYRISEIYVAVTRIATV